MDDVVQVSVKFAESTMTYSPAEPTAGIDRAAALMDPEQAEKFRASYGDEAKKQASQNISAQAQTISAGVSAISADSAVVAVVVGATREQPGKPQERVVVGLQVALTDKTGEWRVVDLVPLTPAPSQ
jgi:ABC-type transporter MlaC component